MGIERTAHCDLCGDEISESDEDNTQAFNDYTVSIGQLAGESDYELYKYLCEDCVQKVYDVLTDLDWENQ